MRNLIICLISFIFIINQVNSQEFHNLRKEKSGTKKTQDEKNKTVGSNDLDDLFKSSIYSRSLTSQVGSSFVDILRDSIWKGNIVISGSLTTSPNDTLKSLYQIVNNGGNFNIRYSRNMMKTQKDNYGLYFYPRLSLNLPPISDEINREFSGTIDVGLEYQGKSLGKGETIGVLGKVRLAAIATSQNFTNNEFLKFGAYIEGTIGLLLNKKYIITLTIPYQFIEDTVDETALINISGRVLF
ncbi:MAG: hypothetical protein WAT79_07665 [Saprospiraceae bacterium]